ncbi:hypothetical protein DPMN_020329 [Dreissena polymorpha]|uniref:Uncharacterized protein n=1 Tax=Dreissena polymorpha TaxID=45954 RepID=A0A9D4NKY1_DREPO|nr:hypothetical protein DPMN_020329 [Dreissena polymorpha]
MTIKCSAPTKEEINYAFKLLMNGKCAGPDSIAAETLKADVETRVELLYSNIWEEWQE